MGKKEKAEKMQPVTRNGDNGNAQKYKQGHAKGHGDVACKGKGVRDQTDQVCEQNEHEQRKDKREVFAAF